MLAPERTIEPASRLLELDETKAHLVVQHGDDDTLITGFIHAAEAYLDGYTGILGRALVEQTWSISMAAFANRIDLPLAPVLSIESVKYFAPDGVEQELDASSYSMHTEAAGPFIVPKTGFLWPDVAYRSDAVTVAFVAGYGAPSAVPAPLRTAALMLVASFYDQRETHSATTLSRVPFGVDMLCAPYRRTTI